MTQTRHGIGLEHPLCDRIQLFMILVFFLVLLIDILSYFLLSFSTIVLSMISQPWLLIPALVFFSLSIVLVSKSHNVVFDVPKDAPHILDTGVYGVVRHPMYLGILLFCLGFLCISTSLSATIVLIIFFIIYDRMTMFEECDLEQRLGEEYRSYKQRVSKWVPTFHRNIRQ